MTFCCRTPHSEPCEGRGKCICGMCDCYMINRWEPRTYSGQFCECNDYSCDYWNGLLCGGQVYSIEIFICHQLVKMVPKMTYFLYNKLKFDIFLLFRKMAKNISNVIFCPLFGNIFSQFNFACPRCLALSLSLNYLTKILLKPKLHLVKL